VLIAHGSRDPRHAATVGELAAAVAASRPGLRVETAFLDLCAPDVPHVVAGLAAAGVREAVALPLLLTRAFHAKADVPAVLRRAAVRSPALRLRPAAVLGPSPLLTAALERRLAEAGVRPADRAATSVVLAAAGSSDPAANAVVEQVAGDWRRAAGWAEVVPAYASASGPRTEDAVRALRSRGAGRIAVAPYVLAPGFLPDRIARGALAAGADLLAPVLGPAPEVADLILHRYAQALAAAPLPAAA
jgi:sirohydrochlorin ferrochelatase